MVTIAAPERLPARHSGQRLRVHLGRAGLLLVALGTWQLAAMADLASDRLLPTPGEVGTAIVELLQRQYFYENLWATMRVIGLGMAIATVLGIALAAAIGMIPVVRDGVYPFVVALNVVPKVALVPLITITMGYTSNSKVFIVVLVAFFPVFLNTLEAIGDAHEDRDRLMQSLGATSTQRLRMHRFPEGASAIFAGVKVSLTIAFIATILSELFIQREGLAYLITAFRVALNTPMMYAVTLLVGALGMLCYFAIELLERRTIFWESADLATAGEQR